MVAVPIQKVGPRPVAGAEFPFRVNPAPAAAPFAHSIMPKQCMIFGIMLKTEVKKEPLAWMHRAWMQTSQLRSMSNILVYIRIPGSGGIQSPDRKEDLTVDQIVERVNVWSASMADRPGGLSTILNGLDEAGADLDFIIARRAPEKPGTSVVFLTPLRGDREIRAASTLGFNLTSSVAAVRIEADNEPGAAARLTELIADAEINVRGFSAAVIGRRYIAYVGFDSPRDAKRAIEAIKEAEAVVA